MRGELIKKRRRKLLFVLLPGFGVVLFLLLSFFAYILYEVTHPNVLAEAVDPGYYLLPFSQLEWAARDGSRLSGWFVPGVKEAPTIILCHGYGSNKTEVLSLASRLHGEGYNLLVCNLRGHGHSSFTRTSLGLYEREDLIDTINFVVANQSREVGIWGVSVGGYAGLYAAGATGKAKAVVADSIYPTVSAFLGLKTRDLLGTDNLLAVWLMKLLFAMYNLAPPGKLNEPIPPAGLADADVLYITGLDSPELGAMTRRLFSELPGRKDILQLAKSRDQYLFAVETRAYDEQVTAFFKKSLPSR